MIRANGRCPSSLLCHFFGLLRRSRLIAGSGKGNRVPARANPTSLLAALLGVFLRNFLERSLACFGAKIKTSCRRALPPVFDSDMPLLCESPDAPPELP